VDTISAGSAPGRSPAGRSSKQAGNGLETTSGDAAALNGAYAVSVGVPTFPVFPFSVRIPVPAL